MRKRKTIRGFRGFWAHERGAIAIIFALSLIPLLLAAGVAIDLIRGQHARTALQAAVDAAVLAVGSNSDSTPETVGPVIQDYLNVNFPRHGLLLTSTDVDFPEGSDRVGFSASASLPTTFMRVAGIDTMNVNARSQAVLADDGPLDLAIVVDITTSMSTPIAGQPRLNHLKTAATGLVNEVMTHPAAKLALVPYFSYVRVDPDAYRSAPWMRVEADREMNVNCRTVTPASGCRQVASTCDGAPCTVTQCTQPAVTACDSAMRTWVGCVGNRPEAYHASIADPTTARYLGFLITNYSTCGPVMTELTDNKTAVLNAITALFVPPGAETYLPSGLIWGWNMLTDEEPLTKARTKDFMRENGGRRAMILMTDGINTRTPEDRLGHRVIPPSQSAAYRNWGPEPISYTQHLTAELCRKIKEDGIELYTVAFTVDDPASDRLLAECATDPGKFYKALTSGELNAAFEEIGDSLKRVRLAR